MRRSALARAIQGSNSIEGYQVAEDDAAAAVDGQEPLSADEKTFLEIQGYRQALGYVLAMRDEDYAAFDTTGIRAMHYMMLSHDYTKSPGRYRIGPIYVRDEHRDLVHRQAGYGRRRWARSGQKFGLGMIQLVKVEDHLRVANMVAQRWPPPCSPVQTLVSPSSPALRNGSGLTPRTTTASWLTPDMVNGNLATMLTCG